MKVGNFRIIGVMVVGCLVISVLGTTRSAYGDVVALYDFPGSQGTALPSASTDSESSSSASGLNIGPGLQGGSSQSTSGISSLTGNPVNALYLRRTNNSTEQYAVEWDKYVTFTVTPTTELSFTSLSFDYYRQTSDAATNFALRTDANGDNFTTTIASGTMSGVSTWNAAELDITGVSSLQNVTTATTFHLYVWGSSLETAISRYDNIELNATLVPEPTSLALLGVGSLFIMRRKRRETNI